MDNPKVKAQVSIEFAVSFVLLVLFVVLVAKMFVWLGSTMVNRHKAYEKTRSMTPGKPEITTFPVVYTHPVKVDFFNNASGKRPMNIFNETP